MAARARSGLRVDALRFQHPLGETQSGVEVRTADEWVPAIEAGRGVAYTMPTVMANFPNTQIVTVPVADLEPGAVLLAWGTTATPSSRPSSHRPGRAEPAFTGDGGESSRSGCFTWRHTSFRVGREPRRTEEPNPCRMSAPIRSL